MPYPKRGDIWLVDLNPTRGREQSGRRPALVLSANLFNVGPAELVVVLPITTKARGIRFHVQVNAPEGGVRATSFIKCEDIRSIARERLLKCWGAVGRPTLEAVEDRVRVLLEL